MRPGSGGEQRLDGVRAAYDTVAADYAAHLPDTRAETPLDLAMVAAFLAAVTPPGGAPTVLDAGCGAGRMSRHLAARGAAVIGLDLSEAMVRQARTRRPDLPVLVASHTALPLRAASVDGVLLWYSTIHTPDDLQHRIHAEVRRVLRPGGHVLVGFQAGSGTHDVAPAYRRHGHDVVLERYRRTPDQEAAWLRAAGLHEVARLARDAAGGESDPQAMVLARRA
ncbi:class I SAM-dependent methyltransferase [Nocardioides sp.]|uniref:class I SAM-dependent methyltransferase n=1 Tax=Nocardioides sp. TaxID=35761 RepID=UPI0035162613